MLWLTSIIIMSVFIQEHPVKKLDILLFLHVAKRLQKKIKKNWDYWENIVTFLKETKWIFYSYRNWLTAGCSGFTQRFVKYLWSIIELISWLYICHCIRNCWFFRGKAVRKGKAYAVFSNKTLLWYGTLTLFPSKTATMCEFPAGFTALDQTVNFPWTLWTIQH